MSGKEVVPAAVEGELLPPCGARGCNITARPNQPMCDAHFVEQAVLSAQRRLAEAAPMAADQLIDLAENSTQPDIRRKAAEAVLDRVGVRPGIDVQLSTAELGTPPGDVLRERLALLRSRLLEPVEETED